MHYLKTLFFTITLLITYSCAHHSTEIFESKLEAGNCLSALENIPEAPPVKLYSAAKNGIGTGASYLATGFGYTADVVIYITGGVVVSGIICSPLIALETAQNRPDGASNKCIHKVFDSFTSTAYGEKNIKSMGESIYANTEDWRCPEVDHISKAIRKVAACYQKKGDNNKAHEQLSNLKNDFLFTKCSSHNEKKIIEIELRNIKL